MKGNSEDVSQLSKVLKDKINESSTNKNNDYQLYDSIDDLTLVWSEGGVCFYSQVLLHSNLNSINSNHNVIQCLKLSKPPIWDVKTIKINKSGSGVLLVGDNGVAVVELPKRWGNPSLFEGGLECLTCRVGYVEEQFFLSQRNLKLIAAEWHPGSLDQSYIVILSSDNYFRVYSLSRLNTVEVIIPIAQLARGDCKKFGVKERVVAFGFGRPWGVCELTETFQALRSSFNDSDFEIEASEEKQKLIEKLLWPIYILLNNGEIYYILTRLTKRFLPIHVVYGPLNMMPSSFDNYGVDFCSLVVVPSSPTVLIISNVDGILHHCIVLDTPEESVSQVTDSVENLSNSLSLMNLDPAKVYLHVYESIYLNFSYAKSPSQSTPILRADDASPSRYLVCHPEGLHAVFVPLIERIFAKDVEFTEGDLESRAEHLICTRPVTSTSDSKIMGVCFSPSGKILVLLNTGNIQVLSFSLSLISMLPSFKFDSELDRMDASKKKYESFEEHIRSFFRRTSSQPLILTSGASLNDVSLEERLNLMQKTTYNLRENYINPQLKARAEIKRRQKLLVDQKEQLMLDLNHVQSKKKALAERTQEFVERFENANEKNILLMKRLEITIGSLVCKMPRLSSTEKRMLEELLEMNGKLSNLKNQIDLIKSKSVWKNNQIEKDSKNESIHQSQQSNLSDNQMACLKMSLSKEGDKLKHLNQKIVQLKEKLNV